MGAIVYIMRHGVQIVPNYLQVDNDDLVGHRNYSKGLKREVNFPIYQQRHVAAGSTTALKG